MEKENWINEVIESTKGIKPAEANPFLFEKILFKIESNKDHAVQEKTFFKSWALAAALMVMVNIVSFMYAMKDKPTQQNETGYVALYKEMGLTENTNY